MFTDQELDILEFEIFPIVNKFNDLQKVFENLDEDQVELFSKWCEYENIDTSEVTIGTFGKEENDILYLSGVRKNGYEKYNGGGYRPWARSIESVITETKITLPKDCSNMFYGCENLEELDVSNGDVSNVEDMYGMFQGCRSLKILNVSNGNVSRVKDMDWMFYKCESLEELDVSNGNVSNVKDIGCIFNRCKSLENLDVSNGNVSKVEIMYNVFYGCENLKKLDVSNGDVSNVNNMYSMFYYCNKLEFLNVSNGNVSNVEIMYSMFYGCEKLKELKGILNGDLNFSLNTDKMFNGTPLLKDKNKIKQKFGE